MSTSICFPVLMLSLSFALWMSPAASARVLVDVPGPVMSILDKTLSGRSITDDPVKEQLDAAKERVVLLEEELLRRKERKQSAKDSLQASMRLADLKVEEAETACAVSRNFNKTTSRCTRLERVSNAFDRLTNVCMRADDPGTCYATRLVNFEVLKMIFEMSCNEAEKLAATIETTKTVCAQIKERRMAQQKSRFRGSPALEAVVDALVELDEIEREIATVRDQIQALSVGASPEPEASPEI